MGLFKRADTGLPYLLLTLLVFLGIYLVEKQLMLYSSQVDIVTISPRNEESEESGTYSENLSIRYSEKVTEVLERIEQENMKTDDAWVQSRYELFNKDEKREYFLRIGNLRYSQHNYQQVIDYLSQLSLNERVKSGVQLSYAYSLSKTEKFEEAISEYRLLVERKPNAQAAYLNLGLVLKKNGLCDEAIPVFRKTIDITSGKKKSKAYLGLGSCLYEQEKFEEAVHALQKATEYRPDSSRNWLMLARAAAGTKKQYDKVLDLYNKAVALDSKNFKLHTQKGRYQLENYDYAGAVQTLKKATRLSNNVQIQELLMWAYLEQGKRNNARKHLQNVTKITRSKKRKKRMEYINLHLAREYKSLINKLDNKHRRTRSENYLRGLTNRKLGYYRSALKIFSALERTQDYGRRALIQKARIKRSQKNYTDSIVLYKQLLDHNNKAPFLWFESALIYEKLNNPLQGKKYIAEAINLKPDNIIYQLTLARLERLDNNADEAIKIVKSILVKKPNSTRSLNLLSDLLLENNNTDQLIATYKKILEINSGNYEVMYRLSQVYLESGRADEAHELLGIIVTEKSDHIKARFLYAKSFYDNGQLPQSLDELNKVLRLDKQHNQSLELKQIILTSLDKNQ